MNAPVSAAQRIAARGAEPIAPAADLIAAAGVAALRAEAELTPKPGLVDAQGNACHPDMSLSMLLASADALHDALHACAAAAAEAAAPGPALRARLGVIGRAGETRMLVVTGGVNTHRGALWALGLLAAGAAISPSVRAAADVAAALAALPDPGLPAAAPSHGVLARQRYGTGGATAEARAGFPHVTGVGLPALRAARQRCARPEHAALVALLSIMAGLDDSCVAHRGGPAALRFVHRRAAAVLDAGGPGTRPGARRLRRFCRAADRRGLSMGGSADLLAATLFLDALYPDHPPAMHPYANPDATTRPIERGVLACRP